MKVRLTALFLCCALLAGCASLLEGEYSASSPHAAAEIPDTVTDLTAVEVADAAALEAALLTLVERGSAYGRLSFQGYAGDPETDLAAACLTIAEETPLGRYAVYYINYSLSQIVNHLEADLSISYRRQHVALTEVTDLTESVRAALGEFRAALVFSLPEGNLTQQEVDAAVDAVYYDDPAVLYRPEAELTLYTTESRGAIAEIAFTYVYSRAELNARLAEVNAAAEAILAECAGLEGDALLLALAQALRRGADFDAETESAENYSRWYHSATAYGALVSGNAIGEGYAMAMKLLLTRLDLPCRVIRGRRDNVAHSWNAVLLENGHFYHLDISALEEESTASPFWNDEEFSALCRWDEEEPPCDGPSLHPAPRLTPATPIEPVPPAKEPPAAEVPPATEERPAEPPAEEEPPAEPEPPIEEEPPAEPEPPEEPPSEEEPIPQEEPIPREEPTAEEIPAGEAPPEEQGVML